MITESIKIPVEVKEQIMEQENNTTRNTCVW